MNRSFASTSLVVLLAACGAKTGLNVPEFDASIPRDAPPDSPFPIDAPIPPDGGPLPPDRCIDLPPTEPPKVVEVDFISRILSAEVYFLVDVTGSMGEEIEAVQDGLRLTIIPGIVAQIPNVRFSVGRYADYPVDPDGSPGGGETPRDDVFRLEQRSTSDLAAVERAVERLALQSGGDVPESTVEALYVSATGDPPGSLVPARDCPAGTVGYPCFEANGSRIFLLITDAPMHNGPGGAESYGPGLLFRNADYEETAVELRRIGAKVIGLYSGPPGEAGLDHLRILARDTGAVRPDGQPIVFDIGADGRSLGADVIEGVRTLVEEVPIDVDALTEDFPDDTFDANEFVIGIRAVSADPAGGATVLGDRFADVRPGTRVRFAVDLANERIMRTAEPQRYRMTIVLRGDLVTRLSETVVDIVIPALDGRGCEDLLPGVMTD